MLRSFSVIRLRAWSPFSSSSCALKFRVRMLYASAAILLIGFAIDFSPLLPATAQTILAPTLARTAATNDSRPSTDDARLRERVEQWWTARKNGDHRKMYELYSPQFRAQRPYESFVSESVARSRIPLDGFELVAFGAPGPDQALAKLKLHLLIPAGSVTTDVEEDWIMSDGQWFKLYKPAVVPRPPPGMQGRIVIPIGAHEQAAPAK